MKSLDKIQHSLSTIKNSLFDKYPIKSLAIFGSFARNEQSEQSDLDLLVEFNDTIGLQFIELADELEEQLDCKIDLVSKKGLKQKYFSAIQSDLIYV